MNVDELEQQVQLQKKKKKKRKKIIIIILLCVLLIGGSVGAILYFMPQKEEKKEVVKKKKKEVQKSLQIVDLKSNKRPIAVMIDNNTGSNNASNHAGLQEAYITYEIIVEGGLTRIMAIFKDRDVSLIGPVRSSRHYFLDYALESDAIYAHFGWSTFAENDIRALGVNNLNGLYLSAPYWRENTIAAPHNVFTTTEKLYEAAKDQGYSVESDQWLLLNYSVDEIQLNKPKKEKVDGKTEEVENSELITANQISIPYSPSQERSYQYDQERKVYLRFTNGVMHQDKTTHEQLHYKNIIIQQVANSTLDSYGRQDLNTVGSGNGYYITDGYALPIHWEKSARGEKTKYTYSDGSQIKVNDGNTFIQIQPVIYQPSFS